MHLSDRELATILASLRIFQDRQKHLPTYVANMDHFTEHAPLTNDQIDDLCDRINVVVEKPEPWCSFILEFGPDVDYKSAGHRLQCLEHLTVELTESGHKRDVHILDSYDVSGDDAGISVCDIDEGGDAKPGTEQFIRYENIEKIHIY